MDGQLRRYFIGIIGFGFVACWSAAGFVTASLALATCAGLVLAPGRVARRSRVERRAQRRRPRATRAVRARPLREERDGPLPLVPDEPSLIFELTAER
ncbi:MAG: hypothetical protein KGL94_10125 [Acidobacteriota bacterium]|nr:hypothetical protein [Acidobacteriota bacterium]